MWANVLVGPKAMELAEVAPPRRADLAPGEVVLDFRAGAICGSDLPAFHGDFWPGPDRYGVAGCPLHEVVGVVAEANETDLLAGQRVVGWAKEQTGLAERFVTEAARVLPLDGRHAGASDLHATMAQPLACVLYAVSRLRDVAGSRVAVIGQGPLGVLFSRVLKDAGAREVVGVDLVDRSDVAPTFGVDVPVRAAAHQWASDLSPGERPDIVVEAVGHQTATLNDAIAALAPLGQVLAFGVPTTEWYATAFHTLFRKHGTIITGTVCAFRLWLERSTAYLADNRHLPEAYFTDAFPASEAQEAFHLASRPAPARLKVGLTPA